MELKDKRIDAALLPFHQFVEELTDVPGVLRDPLGIQQMHVEEVKVDFPILMDIVQTNEGEIEIGAAPPLYYVDTTIGSIYHQISLTVQLEKDE